MKGANTEPSAKTIKVPNKSKMMISGHSQYFLRVFKNAHNSVINSILVALKLIFHRVFLVSLLCYPKRF